MPSFTGGNEDALSCMGNMILSDDDEDLNLDLMKIALGLDGISFGEDVNSG